ncbi:MULTISPECIES: hypothetical protein [unclassified Neptuniibacter]|uniref:hypothetical protein n=1 Tax=unclassified Neptuniibacter TaxID=2630693 RepID=UPI000C58E669|nr:MULTISPECIES: hypothetical protein [unclassified Neptuniibacter]MAY42195.1 hypothetical protein [Oceanospirillaceae bacterium]|tara:strand:+ start:7232 stop:8413 length:1182 start_codon:yes stop_codon:yes gene_type:complete
MLSRLAGFYFCFLFVSLGFFSVKFFDTGVSVYYFVVFPYFLLGFWALVTGFSAFGICKIDFILFLLVFFNSTYALLDVDYKIDIIIFKTLYLFFSYMGIRCYLVSIENERLLSLIKGVALSVFVFFVFLLCLIVFLFFQLEVEVFGYWEMTLPMVSEIYTFFSPQYDLNGVRSKDIMRNTYGEIFSLFAFLIFFGCFASKGKLGLFSVMISSFMVLFTFSRRAIIDFLIILAVYFRGVNALVVNNFIIISFVVFSLVVIKIFVFGDVSLTRHFYLWDTARFGMIKEVFSVDLSSFLFGGGYGYKFGDKYIHNFVLSQMYMFGVLGFVFSFTFFYLVTKRLCVSIFSNNYAAIILVVPCVGMMVGSSFEGLLTPAGYLSLALGLRFSQNDRVRD